MKTVWKNRSRELSVPSCTETEHLLAEPADLLDEYEEMQMVLAACRTVRSSYPMESPRVKLSTFNRLFKRFRSGSVDTTSKAVSSLDDEATKPRALSDTKKGSRTQVHTTGYLSDLSLQNTALTSGIPSTKLETEAHKTFTPQELHNSMLLALNEKPALSNKSSGEKKASKKQPAGTIEYTVNDGDTLVKIGAQFDVTPSELMKLNRLISRTVFVGQTLFLPDPNYVASHPTTPKSASPVQDSRPKMDIPLATLPTVPGHAVQVTSVTTPVKTSTDQSTPALLQHQKSQVEDEPDKECLQKFLKMPVRRLLDERECEDLTGSEGFTVKGTLLVTPNAIMFDPDVNDPIVIDKDDQLKFSVVVYMECIKSVALFRDISPRMFWKLPEEMRARSPKPEAYRSGQEKRPKVDGHSGLQAEPESGGLNPTRLTPDGASVEGESAQRRMSPDGGDTVVERTSDELKHITEMSPQISDLTIQPGRASKEVEHALNYPQDYTPVSPVTKQMSRSSEMEVCEFSQRQDAEEVFGETRDFGAHMGRSSSEVHRQTSSALGRIYDASPGDMAGHSYLTDRSDSTSDNLNTPTQGFAPVHFTDRSPMTVTTHPKPVPGQRMVLLSQSPVTDLKSEQNRIAEDNEANAPDLHLGGQPDISTVNGGKLLFGNQDNLSDFSSTRNRLSQGETRTSAPGGEDKSSDQSHPGTASSAEQATKSGPDTRISNTSDDTAFPFGDVPNDGKNEDSEDDSSKPGDGSARLPFSPIRTSAQHISSFLSYTSSFFRSTAADKEDSSSAPSSTADGKGRYASLPSMAPYQLQLKSGFTKADISRALGPDPKDFLIRSDSHHFEESPMYLQIRPGVQVGKEVLQPRAFDHRNVNPLLDEYWFVVPRDMADKVYNFLMEWQPDAYGDQEETKPREKFFYDVQKVEGAVTLVKSGQMGLSRRGDEPDGMALSSGEYHSETEKTWEILSKEEVYRAEKEQAINRDEPCDESNFPELIGPTVIIKLEHIRDLMRSLPRNMSVGYNWELVYATHKHGYSLHNLYMRTEDVESDSPVLLFIMDTHSCVFGAYLSNNIRPNDTFYGSGATFLFTFYPTYKKFAWQGVNQFFMHGTKEFFAVGSGEGCFGLWLDGDLNKGRSRECSTFYNEVLSRQEDFSILQLEVWKFVDSSLL